MAVDSEVNKDDLSASEQIIVFLESLKESIDLGVPSRELKYHPDKIIEKLKAVRTAMISVREEMEQMEQDPNEVIHRVEAALAQIDSEFPTESKFLKILIEQKLAPPAFHEKVVDLMCDISDAQTGLVGPRAALATIQNYIEILNLISKDATLQAEAKKFANS